MHILMVKWVILNSVLKTDCHEKIKYLPDLHFIYDFPVHAAFLLQAITEKPNIVLYLADDLSRWDLGCTGNEVVQTPNVDLLAVELNNMAGDSQYATLKEQVKQDLEHWMMEQGDLGIESELPVPFWKRF